MANYTVVKTINNDHEWDADKQTVEVLVASESDVAELPDRFAPGSVAYTADMEYIAVKDLDGTWAEV